MANTLLNISLRELCQFENLSETVIVEVVEHGIAVPVEGEHRDSWVFDTTGVYWLKKAIRIHYDLEIDWVAVAMVIDLLQEKEKLQKEIGCYQQQLERFYQQE